MYLGHHTAQPGPSKNGDATVRPLPHPARYNGAPAVSHSDSAWPA